MAFAGYLPSAKDPGSALLIATILFCVSSNLMLPCLVSLGRRYEKKRIACRGEQDAVDDGNLRAQPSLTKEGSRQPTIEARYPAHDDTMSSVVPASYIHGNGTSRSVASIPWNPIAMVDVLDKVSEASAV